MRTNAVNNISFGEIRSSMYLFNTQKQRETTGKITEELGKHYPLSRKGRTYLDVYEKNGYYIFLNQGKNSDDIVVYVTRDDKSDGIHHDKKETLVGTYSSPEEFSIKDIQKVYIKQREKDFLDYTRNNIAAIIMGILMLLIGCKLYTDFKKVLPIPKGNPALFMKNLFNKNSINFADNVNNGLRIIK